MLTNEMKHKNYSSLLMLQIEKIEKIETFVAIWNRLSQKSKDIELLIESIEFQVVLVQI